MKAMICLGMLLVSMIVLVGCGTNDKAITILQEENAVLQETVTQLSNDLSVAATSLTHATNALVPLAALANTCVVE